MKPENLLTKNLFGVVQGDEQETVFTGVFKLVRLGETRGQNVEVCFGDGSSVAWMLASRKLLEKIGQNAVGSVVKVKFFHEMRRNAGALTATDLTLFEPKVAEKVTNSGQIGAVLSAADTERPHVPKNEVQVPKPVRNAQRELENRKPVVTQAVSSDRTIGQKNQNETLHEKQYSLPAATRSRQIPEIQEIEEVTDFDQKMFPAVAYSQQKFLRPLSETQPPAQEFEHYMPPLKRVKVGPSETQKPLARPEPTPPKIFDVHEDENSNSSIFGQAYLQKTGGAEPVVSLATARKRDDFTRISVAVIVVKMHRPYLRETSKGKRMFQSLDLEDQSDRMQIVFWGDQVNNLKFEEGKPYIFENVKTQTFNKKINLFYAENCAVSYRQLAESDPLINPLKPLLQRQPATIKNTKFSNQNHFMYDKLKVFKLDEIRKSASHIFAQPATEATSLTYLARVRVVDCQDNIGQERCPNCVDAFLDYLAENDTFHCFGCVSSFQIKPNKKLLATLTDDGKMTLECFAANEQVAQRTPKIQPNRQILTRITVSRRPSNAGLEYSYQFDE